jgi:hypothetical protein
MLGAEPRTSLSDTSSTRTTTSYTQDRRHHRWLHDIDLHFNWMPQHNDYEVKMHITVSNPQLTRPIVERDGSIAQHDPTREGSRLHLRRRAHRGRQGQGTHPVKPGGRRVVAG